MNAKRVKKIGIGVVALALVAAVNVGMTFAAWTTEAMTYNKVTAMAVSGEIKEIYEQGQTIVPNTDIEKRVWIKNTGSTDTLVRAEILYQFDDGSPLDPEDISFTLNTNDWKYMDGYYYYKHVLHPNEETEPLFESFKLSGDLKNSDVDRTGKVIINTDFVQAENDGVKYWGTTLEEMGIHNYVPQYPEHKLMHVNFMGRTKGVQMIDGYDMFYNFKGLVPGESRGQDIEVSNEAEEPVYISLRAEVAGYDSTMSEDQRKLVDEMLRKYINITITDDEGQLFYKGPIWGALDKPGENRLESMRWDHDLGYFASGERKNLHIAMTFSQDMPQYADDLIGYVNWVFKVTALDDAEFFSPEPETGIRSLLSTAAPITAAISVISIVLLVIVIKKRPKNQA